MGTHPIFESDFDCLTEWRIPRQTSKWISSKQFRSYRLRKTAKTRPKKWRLTRSQKQKLGENRRHQSKSKKNFQLKMPTGKLDSKTSSKPAKVRQKLTTL